MFEADLVQKEKKKNNFLKKKKKKANSISTSEESNCYRENQAEYLHKKIWIVPASLKTWVK